MGTGGFLIVGEGGTKTEGPCRRDNEVCRVPDPKCFAVRSYIGGPRFLFIVVDWVIGGLITEPVPRPFVLDTSYYA